MPSAALSDRSLISVSGKDAEDLLQGLITTDLDQLGENEARAGALLTPQGKILFDFMISRTANGFRIETGAGQADAFIKRLTMYKLRAAVDLSLESPAGVTVSFGEDAVRGFADSRFEKADSPLYRHYESPPPATVSEASYETLRIANGIAVSGGDYALQDAFPHDVLLDLNGGLSFRKGCYVGQEVVSRMQHRGTARRRVVTVQAATALPETGTPITAAGKPVGTLGSVADGQGLAVVRIDKVGAAMAASEPVLAGDVPVVLSLPAWSGLSFPAEADEASA